MSLLRHLFASIASCFWLAAFTTLATDNLAPDPGFEHNGATDWAMLPFRYDVRLEPAWLAITDGTLGLRAADVAHSGNRSLELFNTGTARGNVDATMPAIAVIEGRRYHVAYQVMNRSAQPAWLLTDISFYNADGNQVWRHYREFLPFSVRSGEWLECALDFEIPRTGAQTMKITVRATGDDFSALFDDFSVTESAPEPIVGRYDGAAELANLPELRIWSDPIQVQTSYREAPPALKPAPLSLRAARNEREAIQVILSPRTNLTGVTLQPGALKNADGATISASNWSVKRIGYIELPASAGAAKAGFRPDPLLPESTFDAPADHNTPCLLAIDVPAEAAPGLYRGELRITAAQGVAATIPVELTVYNFTLPEVARLKTFFYARYPEFKQFDSRPAAEVTDTIYQILRDHRINGNQGEETPMPEWEIVDGHLRITGWDAFDAFVTKRFEVDRMRVMPVPYLYFFGDTGGFYRNQDSSFDRSKVFGGVPYDSPEGQRYLEEYAAQFQTHAQEKFPEIEFLAYIWDEPRFGNIEELRVILESVKRGAPEMKIFLPAPISFAANFPEVDVWCDAFQPFFNQSFHDIAPDASFWIYNWPASLAEHEYFQARFYPWLAYLNDAEGALLWQIFNASAEANPWNNLAATYDCGSATLLYPPLTPGGEFIDSQRFAMIREAIDDFDYMKLLEEHIEAVHPGQGKAYVKKLLAPLIQGPALEYHHQPALPMQLRDQLARALEAPVPQQL